MLSTFAVLAGGIGLLLLGVRQSTIGLEVGGGIYIRRLLERWGRSPLPCFLVGLGIGTPVPASTSMQRAAIGFGGSGLVALRPALFLLAGFTLGATALPLMVVILAQTGNLYGGALSLLGLGTILAWTGPESARGYTGRAAVGVGLFLLALQVLDPELHLIQRVLAIEAIHGAGLPIRIVALAVCGVLATVVLRSFGAALSLTVFAAHSGALSLTDASPLLIGILAGTLVPALRRLRRGTTGTRRGTIAWIYLQSLAVAGSIIIVTFGRPGGWSLPSPFDSAGYVLVLVTLASLVAATLLYIPSTLVLSRWLERQVVPDPMRPSHLDAETTAVPEVALAGLEMEIARASGVARRVGRKILIGARQSRAGMQRQLQTVHQAAHTVEHQVGRMARRPLTKRVATRAAAMPHAAWAYHELTEEVIAFRSAELEEPRGVPAVLKARFRQLKLGTAHLLESSDPRSSEFDEALCRGERDTLAAHASGLRQRLFGLNAKGQLDVATIEGLFQHLDALVRLANLSLDAGLAHIPVASEQAAPEADDEEPGAPLPVDDDDVARAA